MSIDHVQPYVRDVISAAIITVPPLPKFRSVSTVSCCYRRLETHWYPNMCGDDCIQPNEIIWDARMNNHQRVVVVDHSKLPQRIYREEEEEGLEQ
jgi:hypothetical protein